MHSCSTLPHLDDPQVSIPLSVRYSVTSHALYCGHLYTNVVVSNILSVHYRDITLFLSNTQVVDFLLSLFPYSLSCWLSCITNLQEPNSLPPTQTLIRAFHHHQTNCQIVTKNLFLLEQLPPPITESWWGPHQPSWNPPMN